ATPEHAQAHRRTQHRAVAGSVSHHAHPARNTGPELPGHRRSAARIGRPREDGPVPRPPQVARDRERASLVPPGLADAMTTESANNDCNLFLDQLDAWLACEYLADHMQQHHDS